MRRGSLNLIADLGDLGRPNAIEESNHIAVKSLGIGADGNFGVCIPLMNLHQPRKNLLIQHQDIIEISPP